MSPLQKALPDLERPVWTWWHLCTLHYKMSLWFILRVGPPGAGALPLLLTTVFPPLIPPSCQDKGNGLILGTLEAWAHNLNTTTYELRGSGWTDPSSLWAAVPQLENGQSNFAKQERRMHLPGLMGQHWAVPVVGFPSPSLFSGRGEERESVESFAFLLPLMTPCLLELFIQ